MASLPEISSSSTPVNNDREQQPQDSSKSSNGTTNSFKTILNGLNALSGVGILSIPHALASGGWLSLIFFIVIAMVGYYSSVLIKRILENDQTLQSFSDIAH
ncbi:Transmembrane amino acid transporter family protein [Euphorbia peplus]|nr:Transmembrane amino acid transporter family protein [Euphorbia peplus]